MYFDQAIALKPDGSLELWRGRSMAHSELKHWDDAVDDLSKAIALKPDAQLWRARGKAHINLGHWDDAVADYSKLLERNPADMDAMNYRTQA